MAKIRLNDKQRTQLWDHLADRARSVDETNDCAVKAIAAATGIDYLIVHAALAAEGRRHGGSTHTRMMARALDKMGFEIRYWRYKYRSFDGETRDVEPWARCNMTAIVNRYPGRHAEVLRYVTTHHPVRFAKQWDFAKGRAFIAHTNGGGHVAAIVDGVVHDWTKGRAARVVEMWEILKK